MTGTPLKRSPLEKHIFKSSLKYFLHKMISCLKRGIQGHNKADIYRN
jgi:hypothetical protein